MRDGHGLGVTIRPSGSNPKPSCAQSRSNDVTRKTTPIDEAYRAYEAARFVFRT
jgi:hypothetical protein